MKHTTTLRQSGAWRHRSLSALSCGALLACSAGAALAQSSVTVYGNLDVAINKETNAGMKMDRGYNNWIGFKGQEDLGGGMSTIFNMQTRFKIDTGAQERPQTFWQGESTVGLRSTSLGTVRLGRAVTPLWDNIWLFEPWYNSGFNASLATYQTGSFSSDGITDVSLGYANFARISNGVFYNSPDISGWRVAIAGEVEKNANVATKARNTGISVNYAKGPLGAMVSYERNANTDDIYFLGGSYAIGNLTVMGSYARTKLLGLAEERLAVLAGTYAVGIDTIKAGYGRNLVNSNNKISLGYNHPLSKRTNLYADLYREKTTTHVTGYAIGMNHTF